MPKARSGERRQDILETLARLLHERQGEPITTSVLARAVGVSEAALYRHFPSKAKMFEALIEFIETSLFSRVNRIVAEEPRVDLQIQQVVQLVLGFAEKNPGIASIMQGGALVGETDYLRARTAKLFERLETELKQLLRAAHAKGVKVPPASETASLVLAVIEGRLAHAVRAGFAVSPLQGFNEQWQLLQRALFPEQAPP